MIQINKQLNRPDGGVVAPGSLIKFEPKFNKDALTVTYFLTHYVSQTAIDEGKKPIPGVEDFKYQIQKQCDVDEYLKLNDAGAADLVEEWLKEIIDGLIGAGNTEIV